MIKKIGAKLGQKLLRLYALSVVAPAVVGVTTLGLVTYMQPMSAPTYIQTRKSAVKSATHHVSVPPKASLPVAAASQPVTPPATPTPAPVKAPVQTGTSKPEPVVTPSPNSSVSGLTPTAPQTSHPQTTTGYMSTNWSGYLATNSSFTGVSAAWSATLATGNGVSTSADSTWIGIGGVTSGDLIQVGTQNIITASGQVSTAAFYEMLPNIAQPITGLTVTPGDSMTATVTELSASQWTISITDATDGQSFTTTVSYASSLSSAEWIEEDPSFSSRRQIPFDNFHQAVFTAGSTVANGITITIAASTAQPVTMVNSSGQAIAVPSAIGADGTSFTVVP